MIHCCDANGNLTNDAKKGTTITYNELNKPTIIVQNNTFDRVVFEYDAAGVRVSKTVIISGNSTKEYYIAGLVVQSSNTVKYFAMAEGRVRNNSGTLVFEYFITDPQGNTRVSFEDNGSGTAVVRQENSYYPFGMPMAGNYMPTDANKKLYNAGSEWQDDPIAIGFGGLIDYYSTFFREYDPVIGRFNSVDPKAEITVELSIYHYSGNNPVNFNDPMGDWFTDGVGGFGANRNLGGSLSWENAWDKKMSDLSWADFETGGNGNGDMFLLSRGVITPEMVARYYQMSWGNQASNISATTANGGFNLSFTATSSGQHYNNTVFVSNAAITENINIAFGDQNGSSTGWLPPASFSLNALNTSLGAFEHSYSLTTLGYGFKESWYKLKTYANGWTGNQYVSTSNISKVFKIGGTITFGVSTVVDGIGVYNYYKNGPNSPNAVHPAKAVTNLGFGIYSLAGGPVGWTIGAIYFGIGATIGWPTAIEGIIFMEKNKAELRKLNIMNYSDWKY